MFGLTEPNIRVPGKIKSVRAKERLPIPTDRSTRVVGRMIK